MKAPDLFSAADRERIRYAIEQAELQTSGELRVFIDDDCKEDVLDKAAFIFSELEMHKTELRNGVLIYLAVNHKKFAIIGDAGIHSKVGEQFWTKTKSEMAAYFVAGRFAEGLEHGVKEAGEKLKAFFPRLTDDVNELSDDIIFGGGDSE